MDGDGNEAQPGVVVFDVLEETADLDTAQPVGVLVQEEVVYLVCVGLAPGRVSQADAFEAAEQVAEEFIANTSRRDDFFMELDDRHAGVAVDRTRRLVEQLKAGAGRAENRADSVMVKLPIEGVRELLARLSVDDFAEVGRYEKATVDTLKAALEEVDEG